MIINVYSRLCWSKAIPAYVQNIYPLWDKRCIEFLPLPAFGESVCTLLWVVDIDWEKVSMLQIPPEEEVGRCLM